MNSSIHELIRLRAKVVALTILAFHLPVIAYSQTKQAQPGFHEQRWVSDDGTVSLALPNPKTFVAEPAPKAPFVASWISNDKKIKLGVVHTNLPSHIEFEQATAEERFAKGSKGKVTGLPSTKVGGQEVWRMKSKYAGGEMTKYSFRIKDSLYEVLVASSDPNGMSEEGEIFLNSLIIQVPIDFTPQPDPLLDDYEAPKPGVFDTHNLSKWFGTAAVIAIVLALLFNLFARKKK